MHALALDLRSYPGESHAHDHPYHQVILALEGGLDMEIGGRSGRVDAARGALVPAGTLHAFAGVGRNQFVAARYRQRHPQWSPRGCSPRSTPYFDAPRAVEHLLAYVGSRARGLGPMPITWRRCWRRPWPSPRRRTQAPEAVLKATAFMRRAYARPIAQ